MLLENIMENDKKLNPDGSIAMAVRKMVKKRKS